MNKIEEYKNKLLNQEGYLLDLMYESNNQYPLQSSYMDKYLFYERQKDGIDIDVCKYNMFIYGTCYENSDKKKNIINITESSTISNQKGEKYEIILKSKDDKNSYRGDTAISCNSILTQIVRYEISGRISKKVIHEELRKTCMYNDLQENLEKHAMLCYSVGNFYPIPFFKGKDGRITSLNMAKWHCSSIGYILNFSDDMSVFLEDIKQYFETGEKRGKVVINRISDFYKEWIDFFLMKEKPWEYFVDTYHFKSFVDKEDYKPIQFWNIKKDTIDDVAKTGDPQALISYINGYLEAVNKALEKRTQDILVAIKNVKNDHVIEQLLP